MHPAEASTYLAEKRAGVHDNDDTLTDSAIATVTLTVTANSFTAALARLQNTYDNAAAYWDHYEESSHGPYESTTVAYAFHVAAPENFNGMTEEQARDHLADAYPKVRKELWKIEQ